MKYIMAKNKKKEIIYKKIDEKNVLLSLFALQPLWDKGSSKHKNFF
jgi:hypothetical protein